MDWKWLLDGSSGFRQGLYNWEGIRQIVALLTDLEVPPMKDLDDDGDMLALVGHHEHHEISQGETEDEEETGDEGELGRQPAKSSQEESDSGSIDVTEIGKSHLEVGMCWFHTSEAIRQHADHLPQGRTQVGKMCHEVRMLAGMGPDMFTRAWDALRTSWVERGWTRFLQYFEATWVEQLPGWWVNYLGNGTPRTQAALEGLWPSVHALLGPGRKSPKAVAQLLAERVLPYMARRQRGTGNERPVLTLLERQDAVRLSTEPLDRLYTHKVNGVEWMYCFKRVLGLDRPTVTRQHVEDYERLLSKEQWTFEDVPAFEYAKVQCRIGLL